MSGRFLKTAHISPCMKCLRQISILLRVLTNLNIPNNSGGSDVGFGIYTPSTYSILLTLNMLQLNYSYSGRNIDTIDEGEFASKYNKRSNRASERRENVA